MVKIRLRRMGNKGRPFYRIVVAKSTAGRDGAFVEVLGTYNPISKPSMLQLNSDRALQWLLDGAQPTETAANLLKRDGVLAKFFEARPAAKKNYKFLDKRTAAMSQASAVGPVTEPEPAPVAVAEPVPVVEEPAAEAPAAEEAPAEEAPVAEEAPAEES